MIIYQVSDEPREERAPCGMMPDIAMATASVGHLTVQEDDIAVSTSQPPADLDLDLGDGTSHPSAPVPAVTLPL